MKKRPKVISLAEARLEQERARLVRELKSQAGLAFVLAMQNVIDLQAKRPPEDDLPATVAHLKLELAKLREVVALVGNDVFLEQMLRLSQGKPPAPE